VYICVYVFLQPRLLFKRRRVSVTNSTECNASTRATRRLHGRAHIFTNVDCDTASNNTAQLDHLVNPFVVGNAILTHDEIVEVTPVTGCVGGEAVVDGDALGVGEMWAGAGAVVGG